MMRGRLEETLMSHDDHRTRADRFRGLNDRGRLLLPNAWDAASARVFERAGFSAIGTTSGGIATARGVPDGEQIGRDAMVAEIAAIVRAVDLPVSADTEAGYGRTPAEVAETVDRVLAAGAVGVNVEDRAYQTSATTMFAVADQERRIAAAREAAVRRGISMVINARTDTFLLGLGESMERRLAMTIARGRAYLASGADLVFVPGLVDVDVVQRAAQVFGGRLSLMALPGAPPADIFFTAGARRVSLGNVAMLATLGALRDMAANVKETGTWTSMERTFFGFAEASCWRRLRYSRVSTPERKDSIGASSSRPSRLSPTLQ
jgi:2-methylisocitrate lyase-like PEP mutase family enzyme